FGHACECGAEAIEEIGPAPLTCSPRQKGALANAQNERANAVDLLDASGSQCFEQCHHDLLREIERSHFVASVFQPPCTYARQHAAAELGFRRRIATSHAMSDGCIFCAVVARLHLASVTRIQVHTILYLAARSSFSRAAKGALPARMACRICASPANV